MIILEGTFENPIGYSFVGVINIWLMTMVSIFLVISYSNIGGAHILFSRVNYVVSAVGILKKIISLW